MMAATLANKLAEELTQLASAGTNRPEGQVQIVDAAVPPTDPVAPQKSLIVGLAALAALIGAMVLVMLLEYLSAAVRSEDELGRPGRCSSVVSTSHGHCSYERGLIDQALDPPPRRLIGSCSRKPRSVRPAGRPARSSLIVGTGSDEASSQIAANLAAITARSGRQVALVDYDSSDWSVTRIFGLYDRSTGHRSNRRLAGRCIQPTRPSLVDDARAPTRHLRRARHDRPGSRLRSSPLWSTRPTS